MLILDTNAYSAFRRGHPGMVSRVGEAEGLGLSVVVLGELLSGFRSGNKFESNILALDLFLSKPQVLVLPVGTVTADWYSKILVILKRKGRPIPTNDIWIAAQAMETGAELISFDKHYGEIAGLKWVRPDQDG